jgi:hypothetical protein
MPSNRWVDRTQPQTLMIATIVMYINAVFGLIDGFILFLFPLGLAFVAGQVASGWGIANEKKWGYWLGIVLSAAFVVFLLLHFSGPALVNLLFYGALVALLLHPQSRSYARTWFR